MTATTMTTMTRTQHTCAMHTVAISCHRLCRLCCCLCVPVFARFATKIICRRVCIRTIVNYINERKVKSSHFPTKWYTQSGGARTTNSENNSNDSATTTQPNHQQELKRTQIENYRQTWKWCARFSRHLCLLVAQNWLSFHFLLAQCGPFVPPPPTPPLRPAPL